MRHGFGWVALAALAAAAVGCSNDTTRTASNSSQTTLSLSQGSLTTLASAAVGFSADLEDGPPGLIDTSAVDSLIVNVDSVEVLPDSILALHHRGEPWGPPGADSEVARLGGGPLGPLPGEFHGREHFPFGPGGIRDSLRDRDSLLLRDSLCWGRLDEDWYTLQISGSGHLDLRHLPTDTAQGLTLAVGTVPAGAYGGARLFVSDAKIYLNTTITSRDSAVTLKPDTGYTVLIPSADHSGIKTRTGFTIPDGATDVVLVFDVGDMVRHAIVTHHGTILIAPPVIGGFGHRHHD